MLPPNISRRDGVGITAALVGVFAVTLLCAELVYALEVYPIQRTGKVSLESAAPGLALTDLGVGRSKRLLVLNISALGGVAKVHQTDKYDARMQLWTNGALDEEWDIGIEWKGGGIVDKDKGDFSFELREEPGGDDTNERLFGMSEKVSDYVLRGGFFEPTHTRDAYAPQLSGIPYDTTLVEVVLVGPDGNDAHMSYEGVYLLMPAAKRRAMEKYGNWDEKGKKTDCVDAIADDDVDGAISETSFVFEVDVFVHEVPRKRKDLCIAASEALVVDYPDCEFHTEQSDAALADPSDTQLNACAVHYAAERDRLAAILLWDNDKDTGVALPAELSLSLNTLVQVFVAEQLLLDDGFGLESEFWVFPGAATVGATRELQSWQYDHDDLMWRLETPDDAGLVFVSRFLEHRVLPMWSSLARNAAFLAALKADGPAHVDAMESYIIDVIDTRANATTEDAAWARTVARWPVYDRQVRARIDAQNIYTYFSHRARIKASHSDELAYQRDWVTRRAARIRTELGKPTVVIAHSNRKNILDRVIERMAPLFLVLVLLCGLSVAYAFGQSCAKPVRAKTASEGPAAQKEGQGADGAAPANGGDGLSQALRLAPL